MYFVCDLEKPFITSVLVSCPTEGSCHALGWIHKRNPEPGFDVCGPSRVLTERETTPTPLCLVSLRPIWFTHGLLLSTHSAT